MITDPVKRFRIRKWIAALRSGKYTQCTHKLTDYNGSFCALGVGVKVYEETRRKGRVSYDSTCLPYDVAEWYGVNTLGYIPDIQASVMRLNDTEDLSFAEIADIMEKSWIGPKLLEDIV